MVRKEVYGKGKIRTHILMDKVVEQQLEINNLQWRDNNDFKHSYFSVWVELTCKKNYSRNKLTKR